MGKVNIYSIYFPHFLFIKEGVIKNMPANNRRFLKQTLQSFFKETVKEDTDQKMQSEGDIIKQYYEKIKLLIDKLDKIYNIELSYLKNILTATKNKKSLYFSSSYLMQSQNLIEQHYKSIFKQNNSLPANYKTFKLQLYKDIYSTIMNFRTYLLGDSSIIQYRIATKINIDTEKSFVQEITIDEEKYLELFNLSRASLSEKIKSMTLDQIIKMIEQNKQLSSVIFSDVAKLQQSSLSKLYADMHKNNNNDNNNNNNNDTIMNTVYSRYQQKLGSSMSPSAKLSSRNRGDIYEIYTKVKEDMGIKADIDESKLNEYLEEGSGSVPFYKGGDYKNLQIKLFNASVTTLDTMKKALQSIYNILQKIYKQLDNKEASSSTAEQIAKQLVDFYTINDEQVDNEVLTKIASMIDTSIKNK